MQIHQDNDFRLATSPGNRLGWIPVPLTNLREIASNNIINAAGNGGLLASDTTPIFEYTNGDTDSAMRLRWAATNVDQLAFNTPLPPDMDFSANMVIKLIAAMGGATDTPPLTLESFFGPGDTKVTDTSAAITGTTPAVYTITIDKSDLETNARKLFYNGEITPGAHGTDTLLLYAMWIEYSRK